MHFYLESLFAGEGFAGAQQCNACWCSLFKAVGGFLGWGYDFEKLKDILANAVCGLFLGWGYDMSTIIITFALTIPTHY